MSEREQLVKVEFSAAFVIKVFADAQFRECLKTAIADAGLIRFVHSSGKSLVVFGNNDFDPSVSNWAWTITELNRRLANYEQWTYAADVYPRVVELIRQAEEANA